GLPRSDIHISSKVTVKDGGIDATVHPNDDVDFTDSFLPQGRLGIQIKAGASFSPTATQIEDELFGGKTPTRENLAPAVRDCMDAGGTYILVCTGKDPTSQAINEAELALEGLLGKCGYEDPDVEVWCQSELIGFLDSFPSLALWVNGNGHGRFQTITSWADQLEMKRPFKAGPKQQGFIDKALEALRGQTAAAHLRIRGEAGIGKTRLMLEALLGADDLAPLTIYTDDAEGFISGELLNELLREDNPFNVLVVVDECNLKCRTAIWNQLGNKGARIKFVSIYNDIDEPSGSTITIDAPPLKDEEVSAIIQEYGIPKDHADRWAYYCDGSPRVAHVIGQNLKNHPDDVLRQPDSVDIWGRYIAGPDDPDSQEVLDRRKVLRFLALFKRFGYEGPVASEGKAIWKLINKEFPSITWFRFQEIIKLLRDQKILQGTTTLYITPKFLHIKLWAEWFETYGSGFDVNAFESDLPPDLVEWFREMYRYAKESPEAMKTVKKLLDEDGPFGSADFFQHRGGAELFLRLTDAAPDAALRRLQKTIGRMSVEEHRNLREGRRQIVWALERIAVWKELFPDAARLLLRLAEAENENYGNNATGVFSELFTPGHGPVAPTEASPEERFSVLVEAITSSSKEQRLVGLKAADDALTTDHFSRLVGAEYQGLRQPPQLWTPKTWGELFDAYRRVWRLVDSQMDTLQDDEHKEALKVLLGHARGVGRMANLAPMVIETLTRLASNTRVDRRDVIETVEDIFRYEASEFEPGILAQWEALRADVTPNDFSSRLERFVGMDRWADQLDEAGERSDKVERTIAELAGEAFEDSDQLRRELQWLVTDQAKNGFLFGYGLGRLDTSNALLADLLEAQRNADKNGSAFFLGGYFKALRERDYEATERQLDAMSTDTRLRVLVPELTWRSGLSDRGAKRVLALARDGGVDAGAFRVFAFGGVIRNLSEPVFLEWIDFLIKTNTSVSVGTAVDLYHFYYQMGSPQLPLPKQPTLALLTAEPFFEAADRAGNVSQEYDWNEVAEAFVEQHPDLSIDLGRKMLAHFGHEHSIVGSFKPQSLGTLQKILKLHADELWPDIASYLGPPIDQRGFRLRHWLRDGGMTLVPAQAILDWIEGDV
ncbi:MAG: hypothetical protein Q7T05_04510, partial [Dehalococcoidia bacterium]|nr:hypothetical protein [Dehalococcoidia bacterium]